MIDPSDPAQLRAAVQEVARQIPAVWGQSWDESDRVGGGSHGVYVSDVYDALKDRLPPGTTEAAFKRHLLDFNSGGHADEAMGLARVDMPGRNATEVEKQRRSGIEHPLIPGQDTFHKINVGTRTLPENSGGIPPTPLDGIPPPAHNGGVGPQGADPKPGGGAMHPDAKIKTAEQVGTPKEDGARLARQRDVLAEFIRQSGLPFQELTDFSAGRTGVFAHDPITGASVEVQPFDGLRLNKRHDGKDRYHGYSPEQKAAIDALIRRIDSGLTRTSTPFDGEPHQARQLRNSGYDPNPEVVNWS